VAEAIEKRQSGIIEVDDNEILRILRQDIVSGKNWYLALLEAVGNWNKTEETIDSRVFHYLIGGEAFDWLVLAERLCLAIDGIIPENEKVELLFNGKAPVNLTTEEFQKLIGGKKYRQHLNFFYGITVEEALFLSVQDEVRKERMSAIFHKDNDQTEEVYRRIYGNTHEELLREFRRGKGYQMRNNTTITEIKEFTYWLFKYRLERCEKPKVASDTKKAMRYLRDQYIKSLKINLKN
jgi:hypothetical protein